MICKLGDFADITMGQSPASSFYNDKGEGTPFLQGNRTFGYKYPTYDTWTTNVTKLAHKGDVIMSVRAPVGDLNFALTDLCLGRGVCSIKAKNGNQDFLFYLLKYSMGKLLSKQSGTVFGSVNHNDIANLEINLPPLSTQKKIASILSAIDDKIELNNRMNENLEEYAKKVFEHWLLTCDGKIQLSKLATNILDYSKNNKENVILINSSDVTEGKFEHHLYSPNVDLKGHFKKRFKKNDILYSEIRPRNKHFAYCNFNADDYIASTRLLIIRSNSEMISPEMLYQYFMLENVLENFTLKTESRSGTFPQGTYEDLVSPEVPYAPITEQVKITPLISDIRQSICSNYLQNEKLASLRDTLLPKLMSGEIDVDSVEI